MQSSCLIVFLYWKCTFLCSQIDSPESLPSTPAPQVFPAVLELLLSVWACTHPCQPGNEQMNCLPKCSKIIFLLVLHIILGFWLRNEIEQIPFVFSKIWAKFQKTTSSIWQTKSLVWICIIKLYKFFFKKTPNRYLLCKRIYIIIILKTQGLFYILSEVLFASTEFHFRFEILFL
jgi:carbon starvation protein CstA